MLSNAHKNTCHALYAYLELAPAGYTIGEIGITASRISLGQEWFLSPSMCPGSCLRGLALRPSADGPPAHVRSPWVLAAEQLLVLMQLRDAWASLGRKRQHQTWQILLSIRPCRPRHYPGRSGLSGFSILIYVSRSTVRCHAEGDRGSYRSAADPDHFGASTAPGTA